MTFSRAGAAGAFATTLAVLVSACGSSSGSGSSASTSGASGGSGSATKQVRVITVSKTTQGTWDPANYAAYTKVAKANGWKLQIGEAVPYGQAAQVLTTWGQQGVDAVFLTDAGFADSMLKAAQQFPKTKFITMSDIATTKGLPNVAAYSIDWCQLGLAQGIGGGLVSKTHKIAVISGLPILPAVKESKGIALGLKLANPSNQMLHVYDGTFTDQGKAASATASVVGKGADVVIADVLGGTAGSVASGAQQAGKYYVGAYADESRFAPKAEVTSGLVDFVKGYQRFADELKTGHFQPTITRTTIKGGSIKLLTPFRLGFSGAVQKKALALMHQAAQGKFDAQLKSCEATTK